MDNRGLVRRIMESMVFHGRSRSVLSIFCFCFFTIRSVRLRRTHTKPEGAFTSSVTTKVEKGSTREY